MPVEAAGALWGKESLGVLREPELSYNSPAAKLPMDLPKTVSQYQSVRSALDDTSGWIGEPANELA